VKTRTSLLSILILTLATALGVLAFLRPFLVPEQSWTAATELAQSHAEDAPLIFFAALGLCLVVILANLETQRMAAHSVAVLGILVGINATLRLVAGPGGFSAMFFLPILCGFVFGADFGFLLGALSMLTSAILTSGIGPWLPFQMFAAGWGGMFAGWLPHFKRWPGLEHLQLAGCGALSGLLYGAVMNLWFWPYLAAVATTDTDSVHWDPQLSLLQTLTRFAAFYLTTSLWWDLCRVAGNVALLLLVGPPVLRLLRRFQRRFNFQFRS
jgi:energy-coupling factor transport system substrate-specific component